jgi:hypothetical protein
MPNTTIQKLTFFTVATVLTEIISKYKGFRTCNDETGEWSTTKNIDTADSHITLCVTVHPVNKFVLIRLIAANEQDWIRFKCDWTDLNATPEHSIIMYSENGPSVVTNCPDAKLVELCNAIDAELQSRQQKKAVG